MDPLNAVLISFIGAESIFMLLGGDPIAGFVPACLIASWAFVIANKHERKHNGERDNPPAQTYDLPAPQAFSVAKKILQTFRHEERRWHLPYVDRSTYSLTAISEWRNKTESDPDSERSGFKQVTLELVIRRQPLSSRVTVQLHWSVVSYGDRLECEVLRSLTTFSLMVALKEAEAKHIAASALYEDEDDELEANFK